MKKNNSKRYKRRIAKKTKKVFKGGSNDNIDIKSPLAVNHNNVLNKLPNSFIGDGFEGDNIKTWPGVTQNEMKATQSNFFPLNNYNTHGDPVGYLKQNNISEHSQDGGMFRNSMKNISRRLIQSSKKLGKEIGKDLADKSFKKTLKPSPLTPLTNKVNKFKVPKSELQSVKSKLNFGGAKNKSKKNGGTNDNLKNLRNKPSSRRTIRRRLRDNNVIPSLDSPFTSLEQALHGLTRHMNESMSLSPQEYLLYYFIKEYVKDMWSTNFANKSRGEWEQHISELINDQSELMWNLDDMRLLPSKGEEEDNREYRELIDAWREYPNIQSGGGLIPQDITNIGRSLTSGIANVYNSLYGVNLSESPLPYKDQPISQDKMENTINVPSDYNKIYNTVNSSVRKID